MASKKSSSSKKSPAGYRSAITGRYVTTAHAKRSPRTTLRETKKK